MAPSICTQHGGANGPELLTQHEAFGFRFLPTACLTVRVSGPASFTLPWQIPGNIG